MRTFLILFFEQKNAKESTLQEMWLKTVNLKKDNYLKDYNFGVLTHDPKTSMPVKFSIYKNVNNQNLLAMETVKTISSLKKEGFQVLGVGINHSVFMKDNDYIAEISLKNQNEINVIFYMKGRDSYYEDYSCAEYR